VTISARLTDSPCILVTSQYGWSANMQRIMKSQPMVDNSAMDYMKGGKIMAINPDNSVRCLASDDMTYWRTYQQRQWLSNLMLCCAVLCLASTGNRIM
jgi:HSP90 family molecular chaperone